MLAFGMVSAMLAARETGRGRVVDCAMTEGASLLMTMLWSLRAAGMWRARDQQLGFGRALLRHL